MKPFFLLLALSVLMGCHDAPTEDAQDAVSELAVAPDAMPAVSLDNGKKWVANPETTEGIEKMKMLTREAVAANRLPAKFVSGLEQEFRTIFEKCTMTGEAHEQLHHYLVPLKKQLEKLKRPGASEKETHTLLQYLDAYSRYFE